MNLSPLKHEPLPPSNMNFTSPPSNMNLSPLKHELLPPSNMNLSPLKHEPSPCNMNFSLQHEPVLQHKPSPDQKM